MVLAAYQDYENISIAAGAEHVINVQGSFVYCIESNLTNFELVLDDGSVPLYFAKGIQYEIAPGEEFFRQVKVRNTSGSTLVVSLLIGFGAVRDNRLVFVQNLQVVEQPANNLLASVVAVPNTTTTQLAPVRAGRKSLTVENIAPLGGAVIYIGGLNTVTNTNGFEIPPQQAFELERNEAAVWCYQNSGGSLNVKILEAWAA